MNPPPQLNGGDDTVLNVCQLELSLLFIINLDLFWKIEMLYQSSLSLFSLLSVVSSFVSSLLTEETLADNYMIAPVDMITDCGFVPNHGGTFFGGSGLADRW